jgi:surfeit locus 1 family protein
MATVKNAVFAVLWIGIVVAGIVLGVWQLDRLAWKTAWLDQIEAAYQTPKLPMSTGPVDHTFFARGHITLQFDPDRIFVVKPRVYHQTFGGHLYQWAGPFPDGTWRWVNRGFVADDGTVKPPVKGIPVMVQVRVPDFNWASIQHHYPEMVDEPAPMMIAVVEPQGSNETYPIPVGTRPNPPNDHLQYAIFWFVMSAVALAMGIFVWVTRVNKK